MCRKPKIGPLPKTIIVLAVILIFISMCRCCCDLVCRGPGLSSAEADAETVRKNVADLIKLFNTDVKASGPLSPLPSDKKYGGSSSSSSAIGGNSSSGSGGGGGGLSSLFSSSSGSNAMARGPPDASWDKRLDRPISRA